MTDSTSPTRPGVLLIDDDPMILCLIERYLKEEGIASQGAATGEEGLACVTEASVGAAVLDLNMPGLHGKEVLRRLACVRPDLPVVILSSQQEISDVVECMRLGAVDYVQKPFQKTRLVTSVKNALRQGELRARVDSLTRELRREEGLAAILGESPIVRDMKQMLQRAAQSDVTVLLEGASGVGKEVAARSVHAESGRRSGPFVAINCGAIPEGLIESELFGHERGAFTGATERRIGRFEQASGGTLFLDEVGELRLDLQVRLLRVLQDKTLRRVGGAQTLKADVRVVAATNRDLREEVRERRFREDLYYRLAVFPIAIPALSERGDDVELLAEAFVQRFARRHRRPITGLTDRARRALVAYEWPGNVRQLENVLERAAILEDGGLISLSSLPDEVVCAHEGEGAGAPEGGAIGSAAGGASEQIRPLEDEERLIILRALELSDWNVREAARALEIGRATIYRKIERYDLRAHRIGP
ncbi:MAG: sigma-54-dependent transcriptional regulator [Planctomycetota bacterium]|jgi:DNA-binding NtrC family response regulator